MTPLEESLYLRYLDQISPKRSNPVSDPHSVTLPFLARFYENFLFDGFGTLYVHDTVFPGSSEAIQWLRDQKKNVRLLTNAASRDSQTIARDLAEKGLEFLPSEIICSGELLPLLNTRLKVRSAFHFGKESSLPLLAHAGIDARLDPDAPVVIATSHLPDGHEDIERARSILQRDNGLLVVLNPDAMAPDVQGDRYPVCGLQCEELRQSTGCRVLYCGKPFPLIFQVAQRSLIPSGGPVLMVGDTTGTDMAGAKLAGLDAALLLSGNTIATEAREDQYRLRIRPDYYLASLSVTEP